jgi:hypothetical protein
VVLALSFAVNAGTFVVIRAVLARLPAPPPAWVVERGKKGPKIPDEGGEGEAKLHPILTRKGMLETAKSMGNSGKWMASVLWMPLYLGVTNPAIGQGTNLLGWLLILLCGLVAWRGARERKWLWLGAMLYCAGMIFRVRVPNPRYLMPVAPLVILAIWLGLEQLMKASRSERSRNTWSVLAKAFLFSVAAVNLALWCTDVYVNRSSHFYKTYRAGEAENLVSSAQYMRAHGVKDGQIAVNQFYVNLDRERTNGRALRATVMLTDRGVRGGPAGCLAEPNEALMKWAAKLDVKYYLYRPPVSPWRALHFKVRWLQELLTKQKNIPDNPSWVLYELRKDGAHKVDLPEMEEMSRVPGIGSD